MLKDRVNIIACGQAGSNIAMEFERLEYDTLIINTSKQDLDSVSVKHKIKLNADGSNKDRNKAKEILSNNIEEVLENVMSYIDKEIVLLIFSGAGGTGSGISPFLASYLAQQNKKVITVIILPDDELESVKACDNSYKALIELEQLKGTENIGCTFILDNKKDDKFKINKEFANLIDSLFSLNCNSRAGNVDEEEILTMLMTFGMCYLTKVSRDKTSNLELINTLQNNIFPPLEKSLTLLYFGLILAKNNINKFDIYKELGSTPFDDFIGYGSNYSLMILSGMPYPITRINLFKEKIKSNKQNIAKTVERLNNNLLSSDDLLDDIKIVINNTVKQSENKISARDLLMKQFR
jgi:hypothetical protein